MIWPAGTPNRIIVPPLIFDPRLKNTPEEPAQDPEKDQNVISMEISRLGYILAVVTWRAIYLYQPKVCIDIIYEYMSIYILLTSRFFSIKLEI